MKKFKIIIIITETKAIPIILTTSIFVLSFNKICNYFLISRLLQIKYSSYCIK